jgi:hypothetical protein
MYGRAIVIKVATYRVPSAIFVFLFLNIMIASATKLRVPVLSRVRYVRSSPLLVPLQCIEILGVCNYSTKDRRDTVYARSGSNWNEPYMETLGIKVTDAVDDKEFFGFNLPDTFLRNDDVTILKALNLCTKEDIESECENSNIPFYVQEVLQALLQSLFHSSTEESGGNELGKAMMRLIGIFGTKGLTMDGPKQIPMMMCGKKKYVNPDIVIQKLGTSKMLLLVQEDKVTVGSSYLVPEPQLAAAMIAAFGHNRSKYKVKNQTMYGIIMYGTLSTFYKCDIDTIIHTSIQMGSKQDEAIMNMIRYSITDSGSAFFAVKSSMNMSDTLRCYEAMRIVLTSEVGKH